MGNCVKGGTLKIDTIDRRIKEQEVIKELLVEAEKREKNEKTSDPKRARKKPQDDDNFFENTEENNDNDAKKRKKRPQFGTLKNQHSTIDSFDMSSDKKLKPKEIVQNNENKVENVVQEQQTKGTFDRSQTVTLQKLQNDNIEEQRLKCETYVKQQINDLNLEKNIVSSVFQLLRDYLSHIKETKKYWVSMKFIGFSKAENNSTYVGGSLNIVVEYNTGEMTKLRIVHSKDLDKANYDLDTFVFHSKLDHDNLIKVNDFNFRISPKYARYFIFSESAYNEISLQQMIAIQAKTEKHQITSSSFSQMFGELLNLLTYLASANFTHGGIRPSNIYIKKQLQKDGKYIQKALLDLSLANDCFNRRNTKFREFAFRKSSDLQMFAIAMLSFISSMDIDAIDESQKKSIIQAKLSAPSIMQIDNDIRYTLSCILKGSDMIMEFGACEIKNHLDNSQNYGNQLGLNRPNQQKNSYQFCCFVNNRCELNVYSFYTKWAFGFRVYESLEFDRKVNIRMHYCCGEYIYIIYECEESSDLFLSRINLKKKCLDNKSLNIIKVLSDSFCKFQGVKTEEEIDIMRAFENVDSKNEGLVNSDNFLQFALDNKFKDILKNQPEDISTVISYFDEQDTGKLNFYEFKNMIQYIMYSRPFITIEVKELVEVPRHYQPASLIKKGNYLYLIGGLYQSLPTNKCFRYFLKNLKESQEIALLNSFSSKAFLTEAKEGNKIVCWSWNGNTDFFAKRGEEKNTIAINVSEVLNSQNQTDAHMKKNQNILKFQDSLEYKNAMMSQRSQGMKEMMPQRSLVSFLKLDRTMSFPVNLQIEKTQLGENNDRIQMSVYNVEKNQWSSCLLEENNVLQSENFILPLNNQGQIIVFEKANYQNAWLVDIELNDIVFHQMRLFFEEKQAVERMIRGVVENRLNVVLYENSLLFLAKSAESSAFQYCVFIINEETGRVTFNSYELVSYLGRYDRVSKTQLRYQKLRKTNPLLLSSQSSIMSANLPKLQSKFKIQRYTAEKTLAQFGETSIYSAYRASMPNVDIKIFTRIVNNSTEKIDDVYETLKFLTENRLTGRIAPVKDAFFVFDSNSQIKLNLVYTSEDVGPTMAEVIKQLLSMQNDARCKRISKNVPKKKNVKNSGQSSSKPAEMSNQHLKRRVSQILTKAHRSGSILGDPQSNVKKGQVKFPARLYELVGSLRNVMICIHYMQQHRFYLKEISPHTLLSVRNGKYFSPMNFFHENTFTTINSEIIEPIIQDNSLAFQDYLSPQLLKAHLQGQNLNDISYNIHKANIYSLGLIFLQYASLKPIKGFNKMDNASQIKMSMSINSLSFPKYIQDVLVAMLRVSEEERANAAQILDQLHSIVEEHHLDIYFPQLSSFSPFRGNPQTSDASIDFFFTLDNPQKIIYLGGKQLFLEFKRTFKIDNKLTIESNTIISITKYSQGFICIIKLSSNPTEQMPQSIMRYFVVRLIGLTYNPKQLSGSVIGIIPSLTGRDILSLNLHTTDDNTLLICGGSENSSIGQLEIKEVFLYDIKKGQEESESDFKDSYNRITRLDDLKRGIVGSAQIIPYDPTSDDHRLFNYDYPSDEETVNNHNILERSEQDEDDQPNQDETNLINSHQDSDDEEEERKEENSDVGSVKISEYSDQRIFTPEIKLEFYILDQHPIQQDLSSFKRTLSLQILKQDGSIEQKYIRLKNVQTKRDKQSQLSFKSSQPFATTQFLQSDTDVQFVPLTDSLVIGLDINMNAYLVSLISCKSLNLSIIYDVAIDENSQSMDNLHRIGQKFYQILSQKSFLILFKREGDLISLTYELDTEKQALHLISQAVVVENYSFAQNREIVSEEKPSEIVISPLKNTRIVLPLLTAETIMSPDEQKRHEFPKPQTNFAVGEDTLSNNNNSFHSNQQPIQKIQEEPEDDETPFSLKIISDEYNLKRKQKFSHQRNLIPLSKDKNKNSNVKEDDAIESIQSKQEGIFEERKEEEQTEFSVTGQPVIIKQQNNEEIIPQLEPQNTIDILNIINNHINQNCQILSEKSKESSPPQLPNKILQFYNNGDVSQNENKLFFHSPDKIQEGESPSHHQHIESNNVELQDEQNVFFREPNEVFANDKNVINLDQFVSEKDNGDFKIVTKPPIEEEIDVNTYWIKQNSLKFDRFLSKPIVQLQEIQGQYIVDNYDDFNMNMSNQLNIDHSYNKNGSSNMLMIVEDQ